MGPYAGVTVTSPYVDSNTFTMGNPMPERPWPDARVDFIPQSRNNKLIVFADEKSTLKVHKIENFFGSDFEFCVILLLVMLNY